MGVVLVVGGLIGLAYPFTPFLQQVVRDVTGQGTKAELPAPDALPASEADPGQADGPAEGANRVIIPKIGVDIEVFEGDIRALNKGAWRMPQTSTPDKGGNTVITAHRFKYTSGPRTFALIDRLTVGDEITVIWNSQQYKYRIRETRVIEPTAVEILDPTPNAQLTLFTCHPMFSTKQRFLVVADPV